MVVTLPKNCHKILGNLDLVVSGLFLSVTVLVVIVNVVLRYIFRDGLFWAEEVSTTAFIWSVFIGSAAAYRHKMHIGIDFISKLGPPSWQNFIAVLIDAAMLVINSYIVYLTFLFIQANKLKRTPVLDIPALYVNLALTVGFSLMVVYALAFLYKDSRKLFGFHEREEKSC